MITERAKAIECDMCKKSEIVNDSTYDRYCDVAFLKQPLIEICSYDICLACKNQLRAYIENFSRNIVGTSKS